jgi:enamine deaminase RidA (YjgF/YER057c/UK114 family)
LTYYGVNYQSAHLEIVRSARDQFVNLERPPASALIGVAALALSSVLIEVDAFAVAP